MQYWLMKTEPETFGWDDLVKAGKTCWDGVRNYAARNHMKAMNLGDQVLIYHSVSDKAVVGIAEISREAYQDPTDDNPAWVAVDVVPKTPLKQQVSLNEIKATPALQNIGLVRQGRLSVMPLSAEEYETILKLGQKA